MTRSPGFTLIELLVVIVIIGISMSVGIANFRDFGRRQEVDNFARLLEGDLRSAQSDAAAGRRLTGCNGNFLGYQVSFTAAAVGGNNSNSTTYTLSSRCQASTVQIKSVTLPQNLFLRINRNPTAGAVTILFKTLQLGTDIAPGNDLTLTVSHNNNVRTSVVTVTSGGEVK